MGPERFTMSSFLTHAFCLLVLLFWGSIEGQRA